jgi:hypothetical protein
MISRFNEMKRKNQLSFFNKEVTSSKTAISNTVSPMKKTYGSVSKSTSIIKSEDVIDVDDAVATANLSGKALPTAGGGMRKIKLEDQEFDFVAPNQFDASMVKPRIFITGIALEDSNLEDMSNEIGVEVVADVFDIHITHVICDKIRRTAKFLCGLNRGVHIITSEWLEDC